VVAMSDMIQFCLVSVSNYELNKQKLLLLIASSSCVFPDVS